MTRELAADPALGRLADAVLIPPFPGPRAPEWICAALGEGLAGVTLFGPNVTDRAQLAALTRQLRAAATEPVIAIDEEGGDVTRISHQTGSDYPGNAALGAVDDVQLTHAVYAALGADLRELGINFNLAPAIDVNTATDNPIIGIRSFGSDTSLVSRHAAAAVTGLQSAGVAACAKHFPGHGSTRLDSHDVIATIEGSLRVLRERDLPPFEAAIKAGVQAVMPSHLRVPELTGDLPASLSYAAQTGLLRGELGFTGVIVSDGLEMRAVSETYGISEAAVRAVMVGTDLLCLGRDTDQLTSWPCGPRWWTRYGQADSLASASRRRPPGLPRCGPGRPRRFWITVRQRAGRRMRASAGPIPAPSATAAPVPAAGTPAPPGQRTARSA
jgi:beta-N-acetylhexosaminidase